MVCVSATEKLRLWVPESKCMQSNLEPLRVENKHSSGLFTRGFNWYDCSIGTELRPKRFLSWVVGYFERSGNESWAVEKSLSFLIRSDCLKMMYWSSRYSLLECTNLRFSSFNMFFCCLAVWLINSHCQSPMFLFFIQLPLSHFTCVEGCTGQRVTAMYNPTESTVRCQMDLVCTFAGLVPRHQFCFSFYCEREIRPQIIYVSYPSRVYTDL